MKCVGLRILLGVSFLAAAAAPTLAAWEFDFRPSQTYASVDVNLPLYEFFVPIKSNLPGGDDLFVVFDSHVPDGWFAQFCQTSTGVCYLDDAEINLPDMNPDELRIDFIMPPGSMGIGWADMHIYRVADPTTWVQESFAVGHGVVLPACAYTFTVANAFQQANPQDVVEFHAPLNSQNGFPDSLMCLMESNLPDGWFAQYCQVSTGICYFGPATIPLGAYANDELRIDFFCFNPEPGVGTVRVKTQSTSNPAIWRALPFRVRTGDIPAGVGDPVGTERLAVHAAPNPITSSTDLRIVLRRPSRVSVRVVDLSGRVVTSLVTDPLGEGVHPIRWDGTDDFGRLLPNGVYFYRVDGEGYPAQGKLTLDR